MQSIELLWSNYGPIIINIAILIVILVVYKIVSKTLRNRYLKVGLSPNYFNALILLVRIALIAVALSVTVSILTTQIFQVVIDPAWFVSLSALIGTAVGLASAQSLSNIVAGFYVLISKPFHVNDYVKIGSAEGMVEEITLNRTSIRLPDETIILIPNSQILTATITNYKVPKREVEELLAEAEKVDEDKTIVEQVKNLLKNEKQVYRHTFEYHVKAEWDLNTVYKALNQVCGKWTGTFKYPPKVVFDSSDAFKNTFKVTLIVDDPELLMKRKSSFIEALTSKVQEDMGLKNSQDKTQSTS
mgnify:CR=1 FL=1